MRYLIIGISIITASSSLLRCIEGETLVHYVYRTTYVYGNESGVNLKMTAYDNGELIDEWDLLSGQQISIGPLRNPFPIPFHSYYAETKGKSKNPNSIVVEFANGKCLFYTDSDPTDRNILYASHYQGFQEVKVENPIDGPLFNPSTFTLTWTFTLEDVEQAVGCDML